MSEALSPIAALMSEAFADWKSLPTWSRHPRRGCWVHGLIARNWNAVGWVPALTAGGARGVIVDRMRTEHPTDRPHHPDHDNGVRRVFSEAEAFAWAFETVELGAPTFADYPNSGAPDWELPHAWIEAKTIQTSDFDQQEWAAARARAGLTGGTPTRMGTVIAVPEALPNKLEDHFDDAVKKSDRQGRDRGLIVYYSLALDANIIDDEAIDALWTRAQQLTHRELGSRVVVGRRLDHAEPALDIGPHSAD